MSSEHAEKLSWVRYHFNHLRRWREYAEKVARAVGDLAPGAKVFVIGSVAEGTPTIYSDVDILVVLDRVDMETKKRLLVDILERAIDLYQLPWDAPVELHIVSREEAERYFRNARRVIEIA
ncbi:nucleotidyltransferase domain-containing protein [Infirmifilum sp. SLHALR2]